MAKARPAADSPPPDQRKLTNLQASRLGQLADLDPKALAGMTVVEIGEKFKWHLDPTWLLFRRICGRVVKKDPITGVYYPVHPGFDGRGAEYAATLDRVTRREVHARIHSPVAPRPESPLRIVLALSPLKGDRMELVVQKATELGVAAIQPVITARRRASSRR